MAISYRTNNQNPINMRDQRSNDRIQRHLQEEVNRKYQGHLFFNIKRGEDVPEGAMVLDNQRAAQLITAVPMKQPWLAVRKVRLFDQDYHDVFSRNISAEKLFLYKVIDDVSEEARPDLPPELQSSFSSVRYTIVYLLACVLELSELGERLLESPGSWLPDKEGEVRTKLGEMMEEVVVSVGFHVESMKEEAPEDTPFDPKVAFKSKSGVLDVERDVVRDSKRAVKRDNAYLYDLEP